MHTILEISRLFKRNATIYVWLCNTKEKVCSTYDLNLEIKNKSFFLCFFTIDKQWDCVFF